mmetsp:Transcript_29519/g.74236  ORF Transcript_29519/g.74236 Transcript_29519/m.74236 type:complete len:83 (+) Transcript_29519:291-539(+)
MVAQEHQQHRAAVTAVVLSADGDHMFSGSADGSICVYDILQHYLPIKYLSTSLPNSKVCVHPSLLAVALLKLCLRGSPIWRG